MVLVGTLVLGARPVELNDLKARVAGGEIDTIRISGALRAGSTGYTSVEAHWQQGPWRFHTQVRQVRGRAGVPADSDGGPVIRTGLGNQLLRIDPGLRVLHDDNISDSEPTLLGWRGPSWLGFTAGMLFLISLVPLISGPQPWRATRWAWFWLLLPPIGSIVFLLLSGPTPLLPHPKDPTRRLIGGWAFLLAIPLMGALAPYRW